ncbi:hypothetical protein C8A03DRAFT_39432, partial [Achaetomium macrosporum]
NPVLWNVSAYGIYQSGKLAKYVVINFDEWNSTTPHQRPTQEFHSDEGIEWAGQSWNYTDGRLLEKGVKKWESYTAMNGIVSPDLPSIEAVLVTLKSAAC